MNVSSSGLRLSMKLCRCTRRGCLTRDIEQARQAHDVMSYVSGIILDRATSSHSIHSTELTHHIHKNVISDGLLIRTDLISSSGAGT